jgi:hypothetical protein
MHQTEIPNRLVLLNYWLMERSNTSNATLSSGADNPLHGQARYILILKKENE